MVELLLVMGILATLFGISTINLINLPAKTATETSVTVLISDIKSQQIKSMVGDTEGRGTPDNYGIKIEPDGYTLFHGQNFIATESSNFKIPNERNFSYSSTFSNNIIVFASGSGEILNFIEGQNSITNTNDSTGQSKTLEINKFGVITDVN